MINERFVANTKPASGGGGVTDHGALTGLAPDDDHTQYQLRTEKGVASGYCELDSGVLVPLTRIPAGIPHASLSGLAANDHTQYALAATLAAYQTLAAKDTNNGYAGLDAAGDIAVGALPKVLNVATVFAALAASANDYAPAGITTATVLVLNATAAVTITGISAGQTEGRILIICQSGAVTTNTVTLAHASTSSAAANRIRCPAGANLVIRADAAVMLVYASGASNAFWRVIVP